jgi:hypothetical protein
VETIEPTGLRALLGNVSYGPAGIEPATLGLKVPLDKLQRTAPS